MSTKNDFKYEADLLCKASFPARMDTDNSPCIVEISVYRFNAVAIASYMLDGKEPLLLFLGFGEDEDVYVTRHEIDDIVTVVRIERIDNGGE